jgi:hypothetical protein
MGNGKKYLCDALATAHFPQGIANSDRQCEHTTHPRKRFDQCGARVLEAGNRLTTQAARDAVTVSLAA